MNLLGSDTHFKSDRISIHVCDNTFLSFEWARCYHDCFTKKFVSTDSVGICLAYILISIHLFLCIGEQFTTLNLDIPWLLSKNTIALSHERWIKREDAGSANAFDNTFDAA